MHLVTSLSRLFRLGLHRGEEFVTIRDELAHVQYYLQIQKVRFGEQLSWETQVDESLLEMRICKFVLQPIVENAIVYGVRSREEGGRIIISAARQGDDAIFEIRDNGVGMGPSELEQVRRRIADSVLRKGEGGFGLWNVNQRIRMYYGAEYGVKIFSEYNVGTTVRVNLRFEHGSV